MKHREPLRLNKVKSVCSEILSWVLFSFISRCYFFLLIWLCFIEFNSYKVWNKMVVMDTFDEKPHVNCNRLSLALYSTTLKTILLEEERLTLTAGLWRHKFKNECVTFSVLVVCSYLHKVTKSIHSLLRVHSFYNWPLTRASPLVRMWSYPSIRSSWGIFAVPAQCLRIKHDR